MICPPVFSVVRALDTRQKVPDSKTDSGMDVCRRLDSFLNGCPDLFSRCVQNMTVAPTTDRKCFLIYISEVYFLIHVFLKLYY